MLYLGYDLNELIEKEKYIKKLSPKKRKLVEAFTTTLDIKKTAKILGWKASRVINMLKKEEVQKAIQYTQELISFRNAITQDYFVEKLKEIIEDEKTRAGDKINAMQLLARITGHIKEKPVEAQQLVILKQEGLTIEAGNKKGKEEEMAVFRITPTQQSE